MLRKYAYQSWGKRFLVKFPFVYTISIAYILLFYTQEFPRAVWLSAIFCVLLLLLSSIRQPGWIFDNIDTKSYSIFASWKSAITLIPISFGFLFFAISLFFDHGMKGTLLLSLRIHTGILILLGIEYLELSILTNYRYEK